MTDNPFNWQHQLPSILVPPPELDAVTASLLQGNGCVVVGGRGMGKSVLLSEVERVRAASPHVRLCRFDTPPVQPNLEGCLVRLGQRLGVSVTPELDALLDAWEANEPGRHLVLLYDEIDALGRIATPGGNLAMDLTAHLEAIRRRRPLGVLVAGGVGSAGWTTPCWARRSCRERTCGTARLSARLRSNGWGRAGWMRPWTPTWSTPSQR